MEPLLGLDSADNKLFLVDEKVSLSPRPPKPLPVFGALPVSLQYYIHAPISVPALSSIPAVASLSEERSAGRHLLSSLLHREEEVGPCTVEAAYSAQRANIPSQILHGSLRSTSLEVNIRHDLPPPHNPNGLRDMIG